jgi:hypothetical protein
MLASCITVLMLPSLSPLTCPLPDAPNPTPTTHPGGKLGELETTAPWDGQDAAVAVEDEFSLDDIMGGDSDDGDSKAEL